MTLDESVTAPYLPFFPPDFRHKQTTGCWTSQLVRGKESGVLALCKDNLLIKKNPREATNSDRGEGRNSGSCQKIDERNSRATEPSLSIPKCLTTRQSQKGVRIMKTLPSLPSIEQRLRHFRSFQLGLVWVHFWVQNQPPGWVQSSAACDPGQFLWHGFPPFEEVRSSLAPWLGSQGCW